MLKRTNGKMSAIEKLKRKIDLQVDVSFIVLWVPLKYFASTKIPR